MIIFDDNHHALRRLSSCKVLYATSWRAARCMLAVPRAWPYNIPKGLAKLGTGEARLAI